MWVRRFYWPLHLTLSSSLRPKYVILTGKIYSNFCLTFAFNLQVKYRPVTREPEVNATSAEAAVLEAEIEYIAELHVAELRTHPAYSAYNNWSRLIVLGIIPFTLLVFFNTKIYKDISERRKRRLR